MAVAETPTPWMEGIGEAVGRVEPVMLSCVRQEMQRLSKGSGKRARLASLALNLSSGFKVLECGGSDVDSEIISAALSLKAWVATVDADLAVTLRARGAKVMGLRSGRVSPFL